MNDNEKFWTFASLLFAAVGIISILEIIRPRMFEEFFLTISENTAWILGLTVGMVLPDIIKKLKSNTVGKMKINQQVDERFVIFLANAAILSFVVSFARGIVIVFLKQYFEYFHILLVQWLVLVYMWFKFVNGFKVHWKYIMTTEIIIVAFTTLILFSIK